MPVATGYVVCRCRPRGGGDWKILEAPTTVRGLRAWIADHRPDLDPDTVEVLYEAVPDPSGGLWTGD